VVTDGHAPVGRPVAVCMYAASAINDGMLTTLLQAVATCNELTWLQLHGSRHRENELSSQVSAKRHMIVAGMVW
jgi:hypothetical protein